MSDTTDDMEHDLARTFCRKCDKHIEECGCEETIPYCYRLVWLMMENKIRGLVDKITEYNKRDWSKATHGQREIWKGMIDNWIEQIEELEKDEKANTLL